MKTYTIKPKASLKNTKFNVSYILKVKKKFKLFSAETALKLCQNFGNKFKKIQKSKHICGFKLFSKDQFFISKLFSYIRLTHVLLSESEIILSHKTNGSHLPVMDCQKSRNYAKII
jgi:hypothetical protein